MDAPGNVTAGKRIRGDGGVELATYHLGGDGPPVMMLHATGFHARCWVPMAESLTPHFSVWAMDQRGHGGSGKAPDGRYDDWDRFVGDLLAVIDAIGGTGWKGVGHSLGGGVLLLAEATRPGTFSNLCVYEPVVIPPDWPVPVDGGRAPLGDLARKRRSTFPSRQAALENYRSKPPFNRFDPLALEMYVEHGFVDLPDGTVTLACVREDEASVFDGAPHSPTWRHLRQVRPPVAVLSGADPDDPVGLIAERVARHLPRGGLHRFADLDHFGPLVAPAEVGSVAAAAFGVEPVHHRCHTS